MNSIIIHHHVTVYIDSQGIWTQSFIAKWINSLSPHFDRVGLLMYESPNKLTKHDTLIEQRNVFLESLGTLGRTWDRFRRIRRIKIICNEISSKYSSLLIRGITPRGYTVYKYTLVSNKYFLMVGSLEDSRPNFNFKNAYKYVMYYIRRNELKLMSLHSVCLCNSKKVARELKEYTNKDVYFSPTSSISEKDIRPFNLKLLAQNEINLIFCGRITTEKGVIELFEAIGLLNARGSRRYKLTMVGSVEDSVESELKYIASNFDFADSVDWLGFIPFGEDLLDIISSMDFCILPSYHEGFPHIIWEAGICSVPMITTNVGGIQDLVSESEVTFIIKKSAESIYDEVLTLISDYDLRRQRAVSLYELACKATLEKNAEILLSVINRKF